MLLWGAGLLLLQLGNVRGAEAIPPVVPVDFDTEDDCPVPTANFEAIKTKVDPSQCSGDAVWDNACQTSCVCEMARAMKLGGIPAEKLSQKNAEACALENLSTLTSPPVSVSDNNEHTRPNNKVHDACWMVVASNV
jgi:hypothetical protein